MEFPRLSIRSRIAAGLTARLVPGCLSEPWTAQTLSQPRPLPAFRHDCQILLIDSLDSDPAVRGNHPSTDAQTLASLGFICFIYWLTRWSPRWQSQTPPSAVSGRCPCTRLSADPSRSVSRAAGRGEVGRRRTGSGARSGWTRRCLGPPGLSVWKHCEKAEERMNFLTCHMTGRCKGWLLYIIDEFGFFIFLFKHEPILADTSVTR